MRVLYEVKDVQVVEIDGEVWYLFEDGGTKDYNIFLRHIEE